MAKMTASMCVNRTAGFIFLTVAVVLFMISIIGFAVFPSIYNKMLHKELALVNNSFAFNIWKDIPLPIYESLYLFNITNKDDFVFNKANLNVTQVGPYTYKSRWYKKDIKWFPNKTVSYREVRTYTFDPERSEGEEDDEIYTLNGPLIIAADYLKDKPSWEKVFASGLLFGLYGETLIIKKKVSELLYGGYEDPIIKYGKIIKRDMPFKDGKFCWLYGQNDTDDGLFTVFTGEDDLSKYNIINSWNGNSKLPYWKSDSCNMINGSNGELNPPIEQDQTAVTVFQTFFCRSINLSYKDDTPVLGLDGKRFVIDANVFANGSMNPENSCFDTKPYLPSGVLDLGPCQSGAPAVLSLPHFYLADPAYLDSTNGMNPNEANCSSHVIFEPNIGFGMELNVRFQINLEVFPVEGLIGYPEIQRGIYPVLWAEIKTTLTDDLAHFIKSSLKDPVTIIYSTLGVAMGLSIILGIVGIIIMLKLKKDSDVPLLSAQDDVRRYSNFSEGKGYSNDFISNDAKQWNNQERAKHLSTEQSESFSHGYQNLDANSSINKNQGDVSLLDSEKDAQKY